MCLSGGQDDIITIYLDLCLSIPRVEDYHFLIFSRWRADTDHKRRKERPKRLRIRSTNFERKGSHREELRSDETGNLGGAAVTSDQEAKVFNVTRVGILENHLFGMSYH